MTDDDKNSVQDSLPSSGELLGILVSKLGIRGAALSSKTAQRYFRGIRVEPDSENDVHDGIAAALVRGGIFPPLTEGNPRWEEALSNVISEHCGYWDRSTAFIKRTSAPTYGIGAAIEWYLQLVVVDLAFRITSAIRLLGLEPPAKGLPIWSKENARSLCIREIQDEIGPEGPSLETLAEKAEVSDNILDEWRAGRARPREDNLMRLASALADYHPLLDSSQLARRLRLHYLLCDMCTFLSEYLGRESVEHVAEILISLIHQLLGETESEDASPGALLRIMLYGSRCNEAASQVRNLAALQQDQQWSEAILASATAMGREAYLQDKAYRDATQLWHPLPTENDEYFPPDYAEYEREFIEQTTRLRDKIAQGDPAADLNFMVERISDLRRRKQQCPTFVQYHYGLGSTLGTYGVLLAKEDWVEEGIQECRIAAQLDPEWDIPLVEIGIILMRRGKFEDARMELESAVEKHGRTEALAFNLAEARMFCRDFAGAIEMFSVVIEQVPKFGEALDRLAFCCIRDGQQRRGHQLAREARHLGSSWTYDGLQDGRLS